MPTSIRVECRTEVLWDAETIASGSTSTSREIDLTGERCSGLFSLQVKNTGDGTVQIQYLVSNDGVVWVTPSVATDIVTAFTKTSGPGASTTDVFAFSPVFARRIRFLATASGGSDVVLTATLARQ